MSEKKKSGRSLNRMFGETLETNPQTGETKIVGKPIEVRFAFPFMHEMRTKSAGGAVLTRPRHDIVVLVPKAGVGGDCPHWKMLASMQMEAATAAWGSWPAGYNPNIQDGDIPHRPKPKPGQVPLTEEQILAKNEWRKGCWVVEASVAPNTIPNVFVFNSSGQKQTIPSQIIEGREMYKSGDYGYIYLNAWTFEQNGNFGINFGTDGVLFSRQGERIGAGGLRSQADMFGSVTPTVGASRLPPGPAPASVPQMQVAPPPAPPMPSAIPAAPAPQYQAAPPVAPPPPPSAPMPPVAAAGAGLPPFPGR